MSILAGAVVVIFIFGCGIGAFVFSKSKFPILAAFLCGVGMVFVAAGIAFAGCIALLSNMR